MPHGRGMWQPTIVDLLLTRVHYPFPFSTDLLRYVPASHSRLTLSVHTARTAWSRLLPALDV
jgi:hypothetical protein